MTDRQAKILELVIEQYAEVGYPIGSLGLSKLFNVSSPTIRAEMNTLEKQGYLSQPHASAGRVPTDKGYRWYVNRITVDHQPSDSHQSKVFDESVRGAGGLKQTVRTAISNLSEITDKASFVTFRNEIYTDGLKKLFNQPEFDNQAAILAVADLLDNLDIWIQEVYLRQPIEVVIGQENPIGKTSGCSLVVSRFNSPLSLNSYIGIIGPTRQDYPQTMSLVLQASQILDEIFNRSSNEEIRS